MMSLCCSIYSRCTTYLITSLLQWVLTPLPTFSPLLCPSSCCVFQGGSDVGIAHHSALQINVFTLTHRGDEEKPQWFFDAVTKTLRICLGVQRMRQLGLFHVPAGGDYGILWPFAVASVRAPRGPIRTWIMELLNNWPREGMIVLPLHS